MRRLAALLAVGALLVAGACRRDGGSPDPSAPAAPPDAAPAAASPAAHLPIADQVVYTCEVSVLDRTATPFAQAEVWAPDEATARARALPEACRRAGGGAACGAEEEGWETSAACRPAADPAAESGARRGWTCVATALKGGVARVQAESTNGVEAACRLAHAAACEVAGGGPACRSLDGGWMVFDRIRGKRMKAGAQP